MAIQEDIQGKLDQMAEAASLPTPQPLTETSSADFEETDAQIAAETGMTVEEMPEYEPVAGLVPELVKKGVKGAKKLLPKTVVESTEAVVESVPKIIERAKKATAAAEKRSVLTDEVPVPQVKAGVMTVVPEDEIGMTKMIEAFGAQKGKGINLVRLMDGATGDTQDAIQYMNAVKNANKDLFDAARRGTMNMEQITEEALRLANANGLDDVVAMFLERKPGEVFNSEEFLSGFLATISVRNEVKALSDKAFAAGATDADKNALRYAMNMEADLLASVSGNVSEGGRLLYTVSQLGQTMGADISGMSARSEKIKRILDTFGGKDNFDVAAKMYASLTDPMAKVEFVKKGRVARTIDALMEAYINSILSSPVTHTVNVFSNFLRLAADIPETALAGVIGGVRTKMGVGGSERVYASEAFASMTDLPEIMRDAFLLGGQAFAKGEPLSNASKIELRSRKAITAKNFEIPEDSLAGRAVDLLGNYYRLPGRFLVTEDEVFKSVASQHLLRKQARRESLALRDDLLEQGKDKAFADAQAAQRYAKILKNPPAYIVDDVRQGAKEMVFQGDLPKFLADLEPAFNHPAVKLIVPFYKTPSNVLLATLERSPIQFGNPKFYQTLKAGGPEADMALSKAVLGSSTFGMLAWAATGGLNENVRINGSGPEDLDARRNLEAMNIKPYTVSFKQDDGSWESYSYAQLGPHAGLMAMAADFAYYMQHEEDASVGEALAMSMTVAVAEYMTQLPMIEGISEITKAFGKEYKTYAEKFKRLGEVAGERVTSATLNIFPTVSSGWAGIERIIAPDGSNTMLPKEGLMGEDVTRLPAPMRGFYEALQKAKDRNPFFNKDLPPKLNRWAEVVPQGSGSGWDMFVPWKNYSSNYTKVGTELERLRAGVAMPDKKKGGVIFNAEQYNFLIQTAMTLDASGLLPGEKSALGTPYDSGNNMYSVMSRAIDTEEYRLMDKEQKVQRLQQITSTFDRMALERLKQKDPDLATRLRIED
jgi:hypothetical protein